MPQGFPNAGNTCFMNAWLQAMTPTMAYDEACARLGSSGRPLVQALCSLLDRPSVRRAKELAHALSRASSQFELGAQGDAHEFGSLVTEGLHTASAVRGESPVSDKLRGEMEYVTTCGYCRHRRVVREEVWDLPVPVPDTSERVELTECIEEALSSELMPEARCDRCGRRSGRTERSTRFSHQPEFLVVHLNRFDSMGHKTHTPVRCKGMCLQIQGRTYCAVATVVHVGSETSGHYLAHVRDRSGQWWIADDSRMTEMDPGDVFFGDVYVAVLQSKN